MIKYIDVSTEGCTGLGNIKACLDYPACGYHDGDSILIAGWILPPEPLNNDIQVIVRVVEDLQHQDFIATRGTRPDVLKAMLPKTEKSTTAMQVGFSIRIPFSRCVTATIIILRDGQELPWYQLTAVTQGSLISFVGKLGQSTSGTLDNINITDITSNIKIYNPSTFDKFQVSVVHPNLKKIRNAVKTDAFIVALYKSENGRVRCGKSALDFKICKSKSIGDHNFLFCRDNTDIDFIIHQHVTSIDGIYYPCNGVYYSFCHGSQNKLVTVIELLLEDIDVFKDNKVQKTAFLIGHGRPYHFMYDGMLGLEIIHRHVKKINDDTRFYILENNAFIDAPKVFNRKQKATFINNKTLASLEQADNIFIKIGALFGSIYSPGRG